MMRLAAFILMGMVGVTAVVTTQDRRPAPGSDHFAGSWMVNPAKTINWAPDYRVEPLVVPEGHVYVLGDNRRNSQDSHAFGPLSLDRVIGVAFFSYWPLDGFGFLPHPNYPTPAPTSPQP